MKVLVVDDSKSDIILISSMLSDFEVVTALTRGSAGRWNRTDIDISFWI
jgi:CheY-like chemotaxis protein